MPFYKTLAAQKKYLSDTSPENILTNYTTKIYMIKMKEINPTNYLDQIATTQLYKYKEKPKVLATGVP